MTDCLESGDPKPEQGETAEDEHEDEDENNKRRPGANWTPSETAPVPASATISPPGTALV